MIVIIGLAFWFLSSVFYEDMQICNIVKSITRNLGHANHNALLKLIYDYFP